jgi:hypothetical protein
MWRNRRVEVEMGLGGLSGCREARESRLVELSVSLSVDRLDREGAFLVHAVTQLQVPGIGEGGTVGCVPARLEAGKFWIGDQAISLRRHPVFSQRLWGCPRCDRSCRFLFLDESGRWLCRACAGLKYACRVTSPLPHLNRILGLRRAVGTSPAPFGPLPIRRRERQWQRLCEIRRLEQALLAAVRADAIPVLQSILDDRPRRPRDHSLDVG